jgi:hypothetical protein
MQLVQDCRKSFKIPVNKLSVEILVFQFPLYQDNVGVNIKRPYQEQSKVFKVKFQKSIPNFMDVFSCISLIL